MKTPESLKRVENGEEIVTTAIHLSEVANILEAKLGLSVALDFLEEPLTAKNVTVLSVSTKDYLHFIIVARERRISVNDVLTYLKMKELGIEEIYTFDKHFSTSTLGVLTK